MILGSEGRYGIITRAIVRVRRLPETEDFYAIFFHDWRSGAEAVREGMVTMYEDGLRKAVNGLLQRVRDGHLPPVAPPSISSQTRTHNAANELVAAGALRREGHRVSLPGPGPALNPIMRERVDRLMATLANGGATPQAG